MLRQHIKVVLLISFIYLYLHLIPHRTWEGWWHLIVFFSLRLIQQLLRFAFFLTVLFGIISVFRIILAVKNIQGCLGKGIASQSPEERNLVWPLQPPHSTKQFPLHWKEHLKEFYLVLHNSCLRTKNHNQLKLSRKQEIENAITPIIIPQEGQH